MPVRYKRASRCTIRGHLSRVLRADETGFRVLSTRWWLHVACTPWWTLDLAHPRRGQEAANTMGILANSQGTLIHDRMSMYLHSPCLHARCVAHS
jgi:transposase